MKESKGDVWEALEEGKGRGKDVITISEIQKKKKKLKTQYGELV